jgi:hypothetical protein
MGPGNPVQKLALMMAVMILGMPPVNGYHADMGSRAQGERGRVEPMFYPSTKIENSMETPVAEKGVNTAAPCRDSPVEPGGPSALRILQQVQLGMESLLKIKAEKGAGGGKKPLEGKNGTPAPGGATGKTDPGERPLRRRWTC